MPGPQTVIENPFLNGPFDEPTRHFRFGDEGITDEVVEGRRASSYFVPIPKAKKKGGQLQFETEWTADRIEESRFINQVRERISRLRAGGWPGVTPTTRALLVLQWIPLENANRRQGSAAQHRSDLGLQRARRDSNPQPSDP